MSKFVVPGGLQHSEGFHRIVNHVARPPYPNANWSADYFVCACGHEIRAGKARKDGSAGASTRSRWDGHLSEKIQAGLVIDVGTVQLTRNHLHFRVMPLQDALDTGYTSKWTYTQGWVICVETTNKTTSKRQILYCYAQQSDAVAKGRDLLRKNKLDGKEVTESLVSEVQESSADAVLRVMVLVDRALETEDLHDIERAREALNEFFLMVNLLEGKRGALATLLNNKLLRGVA